MAAADKRETKPAYFYEMWFGDGAASVLVGDEDVVAEFLGSYSLTYDFVDHYRGSKSEFDYTWEERWLREEGYSKIIPEAVNGLFKKLNISMNDVQKLVFPCLFKAEHRAIGKKLGAAPEKLADTMHEVTGETGVAHALLMLVGALETAKPGDGILLAGFGQGCDALYFKVTENIGKLAERAGLKGSLANKKTTDNYMKFLKFRDLINPEMGIRAEAPVQTAMTALWRNRKMVLGFVGGKCRDCGTAQYPPADLCVNPACGHLGTQDDYEFANVKARVRSFTGDLLAVSVDPPAIYGMVQFEGGGRLMMDFTDSELNDIKVGMPVKMSFRRRVVDTVRGFSQYFWKAVPQTDWIPEIDFQGRVAIVTGAGGGLGRAYALELGRRGAKVVVNDFGGERDGSGSGTAGPADVVVADIKAMGGEAVANYDNVATPEGGQNIVKTALDAFGKVDILINNAGTGSNETVMGATDAKWQYYWDLHVMAAVRLSRGFVPAMRARGGGVILMNASICAKQPLGYEPIYNTSKAALVMFSKCLSNELIPDNIRVNAVNPGLVLTPDWVKTATQLTEGTEQTAEQYLDKIAKDNAPIGRFGTPEEIANFFVFLCSPLASYSVGSTYFVDGGWLNVVA